MAEMSKEMADHHEEMAGHHDKMSEHHKKTSEHHAEKSKHHAAMAESHRKAKKHWIAGAIKHPGAETEAAKRAGMSTHEYMVKHEHDSGKAGARARLGLRLSKMARKK